MALQALFEVDTVAHPPERTLQERFRDTPLSEKGEHFCRDLFYGVLHRQEALDQIIQRIAPEWPIDQMAPVDRNILRLSAYEILFVPDTPNKVAINEAVEIAKTFGGESSGRFVNGVLGTLLSQKQELLAQVQLPQQEQVSSSEASTGDTDADEDLLHHRRSA
jgi:N utilization substance protein B